MSNWHPLPLDQVLASVAADPQAGLTVAEARRRLDEVGPNELAGAPREPWWRILIAQFQDFMVLVLLAATVLSYALGETADAITIIVIVLINAVLGFIQEYRAEQSLEALKQMAAPVARAIRDGSEMAIPAKELVPGDLLLIEAGDRIPADCRLLQATTLEVEESALTGESLPVRKRVEWLGGAEAPLGDRRNMLHLGTTATRGRAVAVVVATGMATEMGKIADLIGEVEEEETPLQRRLEQLGKWLVAVCLGVCTLVVLAGLLRTEQVTGPALTELVLAGVSLAVAAIPEGLPAIVTVALAIGVQRMIRRNAIVRKLQAVETLGCATVICSDKTGTLTKNEMMVRAAWAGGRRYEVTGDGYRPTGEFRVGERQVRPLEEPDLAAALRSALLCNNAQLVQEGGGRRGGRTVHRIQGDPTEGALVVAASKAGYKASQLQQRYARVLEIPFESERRRMTVLTQTPEGEGTVHLKGAPDTVIELCTHMMIDGRTEPLTAEWRRRILAENERMAGEALRVIAVAARAAGTGRPVPVGVGVGAASAGRADVVGAQAGPLSADSLADLDLEAQAARLEEELVLLGLFGMIDPPRPEVKRAVAAATRAGIRTVMITGDHPSTALAVAKELGITSPEGLAVTGRELDALPDGELPTIVQSYRVFARVSPEHKLRIVRAFKAQGEVVAMTGDGVNDAPAVKEADIGIAMGRTGTDVTKEASAMVLADDNFATIVAAVEEGRGIYDNIRKFIRYLLACNTGEVLTMFLAALMKLPLPLLPIQILFVNLVTDGLPAMALGVDPPEPDVMQRAPRRPDEGVFARRLGFKIVARGFLIGLGTLLSFLWVLLTSEVAGSPIADPHLLAKARTMALATLVMAQLIHVFDCRSERRSIFEIGFLGNKWLLAAVASSLTALLLGIYWSPLARLMDSVPLLGGDWACVMVMASLGEVALILRRLMRIGRQSPRTARV
ncbi:MAG TPA: cation-translocating P-type ATPase [Symbiobacteriaceae bacterium]|nr:cation-translocating P-type ATPase [Symbiobacteriaceae bacterium]